jgi:phosphoribosyl 1,2-cyclic phosphodiesterase
LSHERTGVDRFGNLRRTGGIGTLLNVTFFGVRGSTPCPCDANRRYGGNTACVALESPGADPVVLDLGTGLRFWGETLPQDGSFRGAALITHLHWDHVQGLPFFVPILRPGARLAIYGPRQEGETLEQAFEGFMRPPYFPVRYTDLHGAITFHEVADADLAVGDAKVRVREVPHVGRTNGYRIDLGGATVTYISDHQQPTDGTFTVSPSVKELCEGADLLIHDAQYRPDEFMRKADWGHCTVEYALAVAHQTGVRKLVLFHHDPAHDDGEIDLMLASAQKIAEGCGLEVMAAAEGLTISLGSD